jgi:hypothetical protein
MNAQNVAHAIVVLLPVSAAAQILQTPGSEVFLMECYPHRHTSTQSHPWIDPYGYWHNNPAYFPSWDAFLGIVYKNQSSLDATEVDFGLVARGSLIAVAKDVGRFSPGVTIDHEFVVSREIFPLNAVPYCTVLRVRYADGSAWRNPTPPQP